MLGKKVRNILRAPRPARRSGRMWIWDGLGVGCCEGNLERNVTLPDGRGVQKQKMQRESNRKVQNPSG